MNRPIRSDTVQRNGRTCHVVRLTREILVVASVTIGGWKAYIRTVPGRNHAEEWADVLDYGDTLDADIAQFLFPQFDGRPYDR